MASDLLEMPAATAKPNAGCDTELADTCGNCRFFLPRKLAHSDARVGRCRRYPPSGVATVEANEWCGEHKPEGVR